MSFQDKSLQCSDCGTTFTFSAEEQEFFQSRAMLMSQNVVPHVARQESQSDTETATTGPDARCFPRHAPSVARTPKYSLNLAAISRSTVAIATVKSD